MKKFKMEAILNFGIMINVYFLTTRYSRLNLNITATLGLLYKIIYFPFHTTNAVDVLYSSDICNQSAVIAFKL